MFGASSGLEPLQQLTDTTRSVRPATLYPQRVEPSIQYTLSDGLVKYLWRIVGSPPPNRGCRSLPPRRRWPVCGPACSRLPGPQHGCRRSLARERIPRPPPYACAPNRAAKSWLNRVDRIVVISIAIWLTNSEEVRNPPISSITQLQTRHPGPPAYHGKRSAGSVPGRQGAASRRPSGTCALGGP